MRKRYFIEQGPRTRFVVRDESRQVVLVVEQQRNPLLELLGIFVCVGLMIAGGVTTSLVLREMPGGLRAALVLVGSFGPLLLGVLFFRALPARVTQAWFDLEKSKPAFTAIRGKDGQFVLDQLSDE